jgi:hypothetical protein
MCFGNSGTTTPTGSGSTYGLLNSSGGANDYANNIINTNYGSSNITPSFTSDTSYTPTSYYGSTMPSFSSSNNTYTPYTYTPTTSTYQPLDSLSNKFNTENRISSLLNTPKISTTPTSVTNGASGFLSNTWKNTNNLLNGLSGKGTGPNSGQGQNWLPGIASLATMLIPQPKADVKTSADLKNMLNTQSATAEGAATRAKMLEYINNPEKMGGQATTDYITALNTDHDAQDAAELAQFKSDWVARGYSTTSSDYSKAMNDLTTKQNTRRNTEVGAARAALYNTQLTAQLNLISQQYGIEMGLLEDMMNMDIYSASVKYGIKAQEITDFKNAINALITGNIPGTQNASPTK